MSKRAGDVDECEAECDCAATALVRWRRSCVLSKRIVASANSCRKDNASVALYCPSGNSPAANGQMAAAVR